MSQIHVHFTVLGQVGALMSVFIFITQIIVLAIKIAHGFFLSRSYVWLDYNNFVKQTDKLFLV